MADQVVRGRFVRFVAAGVLFQGGATVLDTGSFVGAFLYGMTGSPFAVGAAAMLSRIGWLLPQIVVAHFAQRARRRMAFYVFGAFGRAAAIGLIAVAIGIANWAPGLPFIPVFSCSGPSMPL